MNGPAGVLKRDLTLQPDRLQPDKEWKCRFFEIFLLKNCTAFVQRDVSVASTSHDRRNP